MKEEEEKYNKTYLGFLRKMPESFVLFEPDLAFFDRYL
jgi:hypothetical protein